MICPKCGLKFKEKFQPVDIDTQTIGCPRKGCKERIPLKKEKLGDGYIVENGEKKFFYDVVKKMDEVGI